MVDEVRKLAEKTMKATQEVDEVVKAIQIGTRDNIRMMEDTASVVESTAGLASQAGESLCEIVKTVEESAVQVEHITGVSRSQSEISVGITGNIESVGNVAEETSRLMGEAEQDLRGVLAISEELGRKIETLGK